MEGWVRYYVAALLLLPLLVVWRQNNATFSHEGSIDPWIYFGFFQNLVEFKRGLFPGTYFGERLSWLLPGAAIHRLLPALAANYVLHLGVHTVAAAAFFSIVRRTIDARVATLSTLFFTLHSWLWAATGWDYVDGAAIAYGLLSLALLTRAARLERPGLTLLGAGAAAAGMLYSNLFVATLLPALPATYIVLARLWRRRTLWRSIGDMALWCVAGAALVTGALGAVNYWIEGEFWFFAQSLGAASRLMKANRWHHGITIATGPWAGHIYPHLWLPAMAGVAALAGLAAWLRPRPQPKRIPALLFCGQYVYVAAIMAYFQFFANNAVLGLHFYASYLLPFAFLTLAATLWAQAGDMGERWFGGACAACLLVLERMWADPAGHLLPLWPMGMAVTLALAGVGLAGRIVFRNRVAGVLF
jgi:hypothetical protein